MSSLGEFLERLGLQKYEATLAGQDVDFEALPHLTDEDLKELGLSLGHRRKLLAAVSALTGSSPTAPSAAPETPQALAGARGAKPLPTERSRDIPQPAASERRHMTVMMCDLVGSVALTGALDPEEMHELLRRFQDGCAGAIARFDGFIARFMGDGLLAYFGYPRAHEDAAERAVRAGLRVVEAVRRIEAPDGVPLQVRIGIASGMVVVGDVVANGGSQERAVTGDTPNLAARLQQYAAQPGNVVIAAATRRLVAGLFELEDLGPQTLKGIAEPVRAWRVLAERDAESRFDAQHGETLGAIVGREQEVGLLVERWEEAKSGDGQIVLLCGEAGVGKSRIAQTLRDRIVGDPHLLVRYQCSPFHTNSAFHPAIVQLSHAADFAPADNAETRLDKLERLLRRARPEIDAVAPVLADLLAIPTGARYPALNLSSQQLKQRTIEALADQLLGLAQHQPVLVLLEDAHWIDPSTLELVTLCIDRIQRARVLMVVTFRPEFQLSAGGRSHVTLLQLNRLGRRQCAALATQVTGGRALPAEVLDQIFVKTDGVPLFVEELTKTIVESGLLQREGDRYVLSGPLPPLSIPATLQDSLMARLDRLVAVKDIAQIGAAIGREFSFELLSAVTALRQEALQEALGRLVDAELIHRRGTHAQAIYVFKHALLQDAAYGSLLVSRRQKLHARIAEILAERFPDLAETQPELLAHHFTEAHLPEAAVQYWLKAGQRAAERSANQEAVGHLTRGLRVLEGVADSPKRARAEMLLQLALGMPLIALKGYAARETGATWARARALAEQLGDTEQLTRSLYGLWAFHFVGGEARVGLQIAERFVALATAEGDKDSVLVGNRILGVSLHILGEHADGRAAIERALEQFDPARHRQLAFRFGQDQRSAGLAFLSVMLWLQGFPDQAARTSHEAVADARDLAHANSLGYALAYGGCVVAELLGDQATAARLATTLVGHAEEHGLNLWHAYGLAHRGWTMVEAGDLEPGITQLRRAVEQLGAVRGALRATFHIGRLATALGRVGRPRDGLTAIDEARGIVDRGGEIWCLPELLRQRGDLVLAIGGPNARASAETQFREALELARQHQARAWELRAALSLARLWSGTERMADGHRLLSTVYDSFTEGFETADLRSARSLLQQLR